MSGKARWEIHLDDPRGYRLALLEQAMGFSITRVANHIGAVSISLPGTFNRDLLKPDGLVEFWRAPYGGGLKLVQVGFLRKFTFSEVNGASAVMVSGPDSVELLERRIIGYAAGSSQAEKTDQADDMLKAIVRENMGSGAAAGRNLTSLGFTVLGDVSAGLSITMAFAWKKLLKTCQAICDCSRQNGTDLFFEVVPRMISSTEVGFDFDTYVGQIGHDHTTSQNPVVFGKEWGNLENPVLEYDYTGEINYAYAGGQGEEADREVVQVEDTARSGLSPWNRREGFADARNEGTTAGVTAKAKAFLAANRPRLRFSGELLDTDQTRYGLEWEFGDKVTAVYQGRQFDGMVRAVSIQVDGDGNESIRARLEVEE